MVAMRICGHYRTIRIDGECRTHPRRRGRSDIAELVARYLERPATRRRAVIGTRSTRDDPAKPPDSSYSI